MPSDIYDYEAILQHIGTTSPAEMQFSDGYRLVPESGWPATTKTADVVLVSLPGLLTANRWSLVWASMRLGRHGEPIVVVVCDGITEPTTGVRWTRQP